MATEVVPQFECPKRHRSFLDRFRVAADRHRPKPGTEHMRQVEFSEFRGMRFPLEAADCMDCGAPLIYAPPGVWAVRYHDAVRGGR
jgi:hypothetical protein